MRSLLISTVLSVGFAFFPIGVFKIGPISALFIGHLIGFLKR